MLVLLLGNTGTLGSCPTLPGSGMSALGVTHLSHFHVPLGMLGAAPNAIQKWSKLVWFEHGFWLRGSVQGLSGVQPALSQSMPICTSSMLITD